MGKRQIAAQQTRIRLIQATKKLIEERGFDQVKIEDIAKEAGVAKGTFYTYFKKKEDIISAVSEIEFGRIKESSEKTSDSAYQKIKNYLVGSIEEIINTGIRNCKLWLGKGVENTDPDYLPGKEKLYFDLNVIEEFLKETNITKTDILSQTILSVYYGALTLWCMTDGTIDPLIPVKNYCENELKIALNK